MQRQKKYNTKFSYLTYAIDKEPMDYIAESINRGWDTMRIYHELLKIAKKYKLDMVDRRTVYTWVTRYKQNNGPPRKDLDIV